MLNDAIWEGIKWFEPWEFEDSKHPGSGYRIDSNILYKMEQIRIKANCRITITQAVDMLGEHGHSDNSFHLFKNGCSAVDFFMHTDKSIREQYAIVESFVFGGIGVYYDWKYKGVRVPIGFHIDPRKRVQRWKRIKKFGRTKYIYLLEG